MKNKNIILLTICAGIIIISFFIGAYIGSFEGTDDSSKSMITSIDSSYKPWFKSMLPSPSPEAESMGFAVTAALGGGFIGYYIGRKKNVQSDNSTCKDK